MLRAAIISQDINIRCELEIWRHHNLLRLVTYRICRTESSALRASVTTAGQKVAEMSAGVRGGLKGVKNGR